MKRFCLQIAWQPSRRRKAVEVLGSLRKIFRGTRASPNENGFGKRLIPNYEVRDREYSKENAVNNIAAKV